MARLAVAAASVLAVACMGCIGKGILTVLGPLSGAMLCYRASRSRGVFGSYYWGHLRTRPGERFTLRVVAGVKTMWDIRVDGLPRHCKDDACFATQSP
jgi:hypothetical protein